MNRRLLGLFVFLLAGFGRENGGVRAAEAIHELVPHDAQFVAILRVRSLLADSKLAGEKLVALAALTNGNPITGRLYSLLHNTTLRAENLEEACYFIDELRSENPPANAGIPHYDGFVLRFDKPLPPEAPQAVLFRPKRIRFADADYYGQGADSTNAGLYQVDERTLVVASELSLRKLLKEREEGGAKPAWYRGSLERALSKAHLAFVYRPAEADRRTAGAKLPPVGDFVEWRGQVTAGRRIQIQLEVDCEVEERGAQVGEQVKMFVENARRGLEEFDPTKASQGAQARAAVEKLLGDAKELGGRLLETVAVESRGSTLAVRTDVADEATILAGLLDQLVASMRPVIRTHVEAILRPAPDDTTARIRALLSAAAGMSSADFMKMAASATAPDVDDFDDRPLSLLPFVERSDPEASSEIQAEFQAFDRGVAGTPSPVELAFALGRSEWFGHCSMLIPGDIRDVQVRVKGDTAEGRCEFRRNEHEMGGKVEFTARRDADAWRITEFRLPVRKLKFSVAESGSWKMGELK